MLGLPFGAFLVWWGWRALRAGRIAVTSSREFTGRTAKVFSLLVVVLGVVFIAEGTFSTFCLVRNYAQSRQRERAALDRKKLQVAAEIEYPAEAFSIKWPGAPKPLPVGGVAFGMELDGAEYVVIVELRDMQVNVEENLEKMKGPLVEIYGGTVSDEKKLALDGGIGREWMVKGGESTVWIRQLVGPRRSYTLTVTVPKGKAAPASMREFLESFRFLPELEADPTSPNGDGALSDRNRIWPRAALNRRNGRLFIPFAYAPEPDAYIDKSPVLEPNPKNPEEVGKAILKVLDAFTTEGDLPDYDSYVSPVVRAAGVTTWEEYERGLEACMVERRHNHYHVAYGDSVHTLPLDANAKQIGEAALAALKPVNAD